MNEQTLHKVGIHVKMCKRTQEWGQALPASMRDLVIRKQPGLPKQWTVNVTRSWRTMAVRFQTDACIARHFRLDGIKLTNFYVIARL